MVTVVVVVVVVIVVRVKRSVINAVICFKEFKEKHLHALPERVLSRSSRQFMLGAHSMNTRPRVPAYIFRPVIVWTRYS